MGSVTDGLEDLPMSRLEGKELQKHFGKPLLQFEGSRSPAISPFLPAIFDCCDLLHFATHGVWSPINPWCSCLLLGPKFALYSASIRARLRLPGSVVFMSACESGAGSPNAAGEGGLVQAFLLAGAKSVVASTWMVDDLSSLIFAKAAFSSLAAGEGPVKSLQSASRFTRRLSLDELQGFLSELEITEPHIQDGLARKIEKAQAGEECPFLSPIHWAAQFAADISR